MTDVLIQIRDLLVPISHHYQPEYEEFLGAERRRKGETLRRLVRSGKPLQACMLMDGALGRTAIVEGTKIDRGDLSRLLTSLRENGLLESEVDGRPKLMFSAPELTEIYAE